MKNYKFLLLNILITALIVVIFIQDTFISVTENRENFLPYSDTLGASYKVRIKPGLFELINPSVPKYPFNVRFVIENKTFCSSYKSVTLLVLVLSATANFDKREALRLTWANETLYESYGTVKILFLLGINTDSAVQNHINQEYKMHGDIVQGDFIDRYHNLTHKSTMGLKWATERCRNAKYVLKTDDDIVINLFRIFKNDIFSYTYKMFHVYCRLQSTVIFRDKPSKWYVNENQFNGLLRYPTYCGGSFVMFLNEVVPYVYESATKTPFFWIEDVLLYGIVLHNIPRLIYKRVDPNDVELNNVTSAIKCFVDKKEDCPLYIIMTYKISQVSELWQFILKIQNK